MSALGDRDAWGLAELVRAGEVSPLELVDAAIARIEALDPQLNAVIHRQFERARREASGPLPDGPCRGVPMLLKDYSGAEAGEPHHHGMRALRDASWRAESDSVLVQRFRGAGLLPVGRTNTPELALMGTTEPEAYGATHNPWDLTRSPGGSSGGSAAAVAARMVPVAHANDIAGSIRIPAAQCGLVGLKATRGRIVRGKPADPAIGTYCEGVVTRSVRDTALVVDAITDRSALGPWPAPALPGPLSTEVGADPGRLRIGTNVVAYNGVEVDEGAMAAVWATARLLEALGHHVEEAAPAALFAPELEEVSRALLAANAADEVATWSAALGRRLGPDDLEPTTWAIAEAGHALTSVGLLEALAAQNELARRIRAWWQPEPDDAVAFDLLVTPTTAEPGPPLGDYKRAFRPGRASVFTRPFNLTGQPAISLPLGWPDDGLPRGVQLVAAYGREDVLIRVASQLEAASPWADRRPPVSA